MGAVPALEVLEGPEGAKGVGMVGVEVVDCGCWGEEGTSRTGWEYAPVVGRWFGQFVVFWRGFGGSWVALDVPKGEERGAPTGMRG